MEKNHPHCVKCTVHSCAFKDGSRKAPASCPTVKHADLIEKTLEKYESPENRAVIDGWRELMVPLLDPENPREKYAWSRIDEVAEYARLRHMKRLGIATCYSMINESRLLADILEHKGFEVVSVSCLCGEVAPAALGLHLPGNVFCNPILQAEVLEREGSELNIVMGLCVGHDILFLRHSRVETTPLVVRDCSTGNNPAAALYQSQGMFRERFFGVD